MPAEVRSDEVGGTEEVEAAGEEGACDAVQAGEVPCDLRSVDGEVRSDGALEALFGEDLVAGFAVGHGLHCRMAVGVRCQQAGARDAQCGRKLTGAG